MKSPLTSPDARTARTVAQRWLGVELDGEAEDFSTPNACLYFRGKYYTGTQDTSPAKMADRAEEFVAMLEKANAYFDRREQETNTPGSPLAERLT